MCIYICVCSSYSLLIYYIIALLLYGYTKYNFQQLTLIFMFPLCLQFTLHCPIPLVSSCQLPYSIRCWVKRRFYDSSVVGPICHYYSFHDVYVTTTGGHLVYLSWPQASSHIYATCLSVFVRPGYTGIQVVIRLICTCDVHICIFI